MDKTTLVGADIEGGRRFLELLRREKVPVSAAFWQYDASGDWRLRIVSPLVEALGLRETYRRLDDILSKPSSLPTIDLLDISALSPQSRFYKSLRRELRKTKDWHIRNRHVGDEFVEEGFIYFVK